MLPNICILSSRIELSKEYFYYFVLLFTIYFYFFTILNVIKLFCKVHALKNTIKKIGLKFEYFTEKSTMVNP